MDVRSNIGKIDATIRYAVGIVLLGIVFVVDSPWRWLGLIGFIPIVTAAVSFCPLWSMLGINTRESSGHGPATHMH